MASIRKMMRRSHVYVMVVLLLSATIVHGNGKGKSDSSDESNKWKKKDVRDYTDVDIERLFEQWEDADDEELPEDEQPEWKRPKPKIDLSKLNPNDPEAMLKMTKKGQTLMMFATVAGQPTEKETEDITKIWQTSLFNANIETQRYVVGADRVLFMLKDGSYAWEIKDFLISQERCEVVTIEGQDFPGKGSKQNKGATKTEQKKEKTTKKKKGMKKKKMEDNNNVKTPSNTKTQQKVEL